MAPAHWAQGVDMRWQPGALRIHACWDGSVGVLVCWAAGMLAHADVGEERCIASVLAVWRAAGALARSTRRPITLQVFTKRPPRLL